MLDILFDGLVLLITMIIAIMPFAATTATIYLAAVYFGDESRPRNLLLRAVTIDAFLATVGSSWWAFVALRRIFVGTNAPALPEWTLLIYGISIIMLSIIPVHKFFVYKRIEKMNRESRARREEEITELDLTAED